MIDALINFFNQHTTLTKEEATYLKANIPSRKYSKNGFLLKEGQISKEFYFLIKGCVRLFYNIDGNEKTAFFYTEDQFISSYESFTKQIPSSHNIQATESSEVLVFTHERAYEILDKFPKLEFLARVMMEEELIIYQDIIASFIALNPENRYLKLLSEQPDLVQRVPQHQLASYLGVKPESLSRIRKRIATDSIS